MDEENLALPDTKEQQQQQQEEEQKQQQQQQQQQEQSDDDDDDAQLPLLPCLKPGNSPSCGVKKKLNPVAILLSPSRMLSCLLNSARALVLTILSVLRKILCFWRRSKTTGGFSEIDRRQVICYWFKNLTCFSFPHVFVRYKFVRGGPSDSDLSSWDSWGDDKGGGGRGALRNRHIRRGEEGRRRCKITFRSANHYYFI